MPAKRLAELPSYFERVTRSSPRNSGLPTPGTQAIVFCNGRRVSIFGLRFAQIWFYAPPPNEFVANISPRNATLGTSP
jgi:hypothetical protein